MQRLIITRTPHTVVVFLARFDVAEMTSPGGAAAAALDSIARSLAEICGDGDGGGEHRWDPPRRFADFARRLEAVVRGLAGAPELLSSPAVRTALGGVAADLDASRPTLSVYRGRSPIYILIHCVPLSDALRGRVASLAAWLALLDSPVASLPDLRKKATDLSRDMDQTDLKVLFPPSISVPHPSLIPI